MRAEAEGHVGGSNVRHQSVRTESRMIRFRNSPSWVSSTIAINDLPPSGARVFYSFHRGLGQPLSQRVTTGKLLDNDC
jgi:hypothetical protein